MTDTAVTPFPGVTRRPDSAVWWFVLRAPQDLLHRFDGKPWAVRRSLKTSDLREANDKARVLHAEWAQRFASMRREDNPERVELNPALVATIAAEMRRWMLQADDNMRDFPGGPAALLKAERRRLISEGKLVEGRSSLMIEIDEPKNAPMRALTDDELRIVAEVNAREMAGAAIAMAKRDRLEWGSVSADRGGQFELSPAQVKSAYTIVDRIDVALAQEISVRGKLIAFNSRTMRYEILSGDDGRAYAGKVADDANLESNLVIGQFYEADLRMLVETQSSSGDELIRWVLVRLSASTAEPTSPPATSAP